MSSACWLRLFVSSPSVLNPASPSLEQRELRRILYCNAISCRFFSWIDVFDPGKQIGPAPTFRRAPVTVRTLVLCVGDRLGQVGGPGFSQSILSSGRIRGSLHSRRGQYDGDEVDWNGAIISAHWFCSRVFGRGSGRLTTWLLRALPAFLRR